jgi:hypothetical protein
MHGGDFRKGAYSVRRGLCPFDLNYLEAKPLDKTVIRFGAVLSLQGLAIDVQLQLQVPAYWGCVFILRALDFYGRFRDVGGCRVWSWMAVRSWSYPQSLKRIVVREARR